MKKSATNHENTHRETQKRYKFITQQENTKWKKGKWHRNERGFYASESAYGAFMHQQGESGRILAEVECRKETEENERWQEIRVVRKWRWTRETSLQLAIYAAELALPYWEKEFPDDDRPRKAIEAATGVLLERQQQVAGRAERDATTVALETMAETEAVAEAEEAEKAAHDAAMEAWYFSAPQETVEAAIAASVAAETARQRSVGRAAERAWRAARAAEDAAWEAGGEAEEKRVEEKIGRYLSEWVKGRGGNGKNG